MLVGLETVTPWMDVLLESDPMGGCVSRSGYCDPMDGCVAGESDPMGGCVSRPGDCANMMMCTLNVDMNGTRVCIKRQSAPLSTQQIQVTVEIKTSSCG